jgi:hypothetical protein
MIPGSILKSPCINLYLNYVSYIVKMSFLLLVRYISHKSVVVILNNLHLFSPKCCIYFRQGSAFICSIQLQTPKVSSLAMVPSHSAYAYSVVVYKSCFLRIIFIRDTGPGCSQQWIKLSLNK